ncbi:MFS transporter [Spongiactinospora rosea]|uniref:MFS transporter n=1 Tax=Spongiactinospora rosea TaxID=2248750 RepID=A0A366LL78_9ACTN|nr:MFS transporter [Spongiactinospora rosea]RBQ14678.1 MFS transporter [Spongiactinospora rosea]
MASAPTKAGRREWLGLAILGLPTLLISMDLTVLHLALPAMSADLKPTNTELLWIVDVYGFMVAGLLITMGAIGDRIGRRKLLSIGAVGFGAASVAAAIATSPVMLIGARALLGIAGATLMPSTLSLIRNMFHDPKQRTAAIGIWSMCLGVGTLIGPLVGGALLAYFWWGSVFLPAVPVMMLLLAAGPKLLPEHRDSSAGRPDLLSVLMSILAVLSLVQGLKRIAEHGAEWISIVLIVVALLVGSGLIVRQPKLRTPLIDVRLFRSSAFSGPLTLLMLGVLVMAGSQLFVMQYLMLVRGLSPIQAGLWSLPTTAGVVIGSMGAPALRQKVSLKAVFATALFVLGIGSLLLFFVRAPSDLAITVLGSAVIGLGLGPLVTLGTDSVVAAAPPERAGAASAISETGTELGTALGIAVFGSIGFGVYRDTLAAILPHGVPAEAASAARSTLGAAVATAGDLPAPAGPRLLDAVRLAFIDGFSTVGLIGSITAAVLGVVALVWLRNARPPVPEEAAQMPAGGEG